jgi:Fe-S-cluster-containing dehydrogenase component
MSDLTSKGFKLPVLGDAVTALTRTDFSRRGFLQVLGATSVATLAAGCTRPTQDTVFPYVKPPDDVIPGNALHYTTAMTLGGYATGLLVTAYEGRPTKIEGNPKHPFTAGATGPFEQASILGLYDPSRTHDIRHKGQGTSRESLFGMLAKKAAGFAKDGGRGLRLLLEPSASPLLGESLAQLKAKFPSAVVRFYSASASDASNQGTQLAFGKALKPRYDFKQADVIVSLDADFLVAIAENLRHSLDYAERRADPERLSRHYQLEADHSLTGSSADHRFPMKSADVALSARALLAAVDGSSGVSGSAPDALGAKALAAIAKDLTSHRGTSLVIAGDRQPAAVHAIAALLNEALGNVGKTVRYLADVLLDGNIGPASLKALADEAASGSVDTLITNVFDPVYAHPSDIDVAGLLGKIPNVVYSASHLDRTAALAAWFVPASHYLESWGDARSLDGTVSIVQPLIEPLYNSLTIEELLSGLLDAAPRSAHDLLRTRYRKEAGTEDGDAFWQRALREGFLPRGTEAEAAAPSANRAAVSKAAATLVASSGFELNLRNDYRTFDGRFARNPWLLELPDPVTKLTWDNAAHLSPATAQKLGVDREHVVKVTVGGASVELPVYVVPGHADDALTVSLGWGATDPGAVMVDHDPVNLGYDEDRIGVDLYPFLTQATGYVIGGATVATTDKRYPLAVTQGHFSQEGRDLALSLDVGQEKEKREEALKRIDELKSDHLPSMYAPYAYDGYKWSMAVDMSRCTGCNACVVACIAENNVPMVGKDGVRRGREMHWLRIDRYYEGDEKNPRVVQQPVACVHCENAPCEYVCPVNATVHNEEGLNEMVYNRCVGTRYCSNNCPYKVRRFNFFAYNNDIPATLQMSKNPNVTVRSRGVMEKCTYCVQRIESARINTEINGLPTIRVLGTPSPTNPEELERARGVPMLQSACQQACPTGAIVFGNLNDKDSVAAHMHADPRRFDLLQSLGTRPRTVHLARLTNRNPELA